MKPRSQARRAMPPSSAWMSALVLGAAAATAIGTALPCRAAPGATAAALAAPTVIDAGGPGLRLALSERTRLVYEPQQTAFEPRPYADRTLFERPTPEHRLALEFRRGSDQSPKNLLRVQLSGGSVLHFRPRGGGLAVRWRLEY